MKKEALDSGMSAIKASIEKLAAKKMKAGLLTEEQARDFALSINNIEPSTKLADAKDCDLVIEAIIENIDIKKKFYADLGKVTKPSAILASNTSSLPIMELAKASGRPDKMIGLHFFNPVPLMKLVEVISTTSTAPAVLQASGIYPPIYTNTHTVPNLAFSFVCSLSIEEFVSKIGKVAVPCKDTPGFVVNRLLVPYIAQVRNSVKVRMMTYRLYVLRQWLYMSVVMLR